MYNNKQLLDEVEHDIMNYQNRGLCYLTKPKAEADNTDTRLKIALYFTSPLGSWSDSDEDLRQRLEWIRKKT